MTEKTSSRRLSLLVLLALVALTLCVYLQVWNFDLVGLDDDGYITRNPYVLLGFRGDTIHWAISAVYQGVWQPMIWFSYLTDTTAAHSLAARHIQLGSGNVGVYHLSNVFQHLASTIVLFLILLRMTQSRWRSAFVAAVFAIHPLNVESVAWVAERKNTLSTLFCMLTILAYLGYIRRPGWSRYLLMLALFVLGLMAKAVLVTLPVMLLLLDYWPLQRLDTKPWKALVREKLPMFGLSAASGVMAYVAQRKGGLVAPDELFPLGVRVANGFYSLIKYIWLMVLPRDLSVCYVHPGRLLPVWQVVVCAVAVVSITLLAIRLRRRLPYLMVGWLWYLVTIIPVIGLVQVADQGLADRYVYVPMIGLLMIFAWAAPALVKRATGLPPRVAFAAAGCVIVIALAVMAHRQTGYWRDSVTMYRQVIAVNPESRTGWSGLGSALALRGEHEEAQECLLKAIEIDPRDLTSRTNLGIDLAAEGKYEDAVYYLTQSIEMCPEDPKANYNIAQILVMQRKLKEAARRYRVAVTSQPSFAEAHIGLANTLLLLKDQKGAIAHYSQALRFCPKDPNVHFLLAGVLEETGSLSKAIDHYRAALRLDPRHWRAANNLAWILATNTDQRFFRPREATRIAAAAVRKLARPQPELLDTLAVAYAADGRYDLAAAAAGRAADVAKAANQAGFEKQMREKLKTYRMRCQLPSRS